MRRGAESAVAAENLKLRKKRGASIVRFGSKSDRCSGDARGSVVANGAQRELASSGHSSSERVSMVRIGVHAVRCVYSHPPLLSPACLLCSHSAALSSGGRVAHSASRAVRQSVHRCAPRVGNAGRISAAARRGSALVLLLASSPKRTAASAACRSACAASHCARSRWETLRPVAPPTRPATAHSGAIAGPHPHAPTRIVGSAPATVQDHDADDGALSRRGARAHAAAATHAAVECTVP